MAHVRMLSTLLLTYDNTIKTGFSHEMPVFSIYFFSIQQLYYF